RDVEPETGHSSGRINPSLNSFHFITAFRPSMDDQGLVPEVQEPNFDRPGFSIELGLAIQVVRSSRFGKDFDHEKNRKLAVKALEIRVGVERNDEKVGLEITSVPHPEGGRSCQDMSGLTIGGETLEEENQKLDIELVPEFGGRGYVD